MHLLVECCESVQNFLPFHLLTKFYMLFCTCVEHKVLVLRKGTKGDLTIRCCGEYVDLQERSNRKLEKLHNKDPDNSHSLRSLVS